MASSLRQRIPFQFSEDGELDERVLDEQEQEEVIERLRKANEDSNMIYYLGLQVVVGLSLLIHIVYLFNASKVSPLAVFFDGLPSTPVPLASGLVLLQILVHINLGICSLPSSHHLRRSLSNTTTALPYKLSIPLPLSHPVAVVLPMIAPTYAILYGCGRADVIWWSVSGIVAGIVALVVKWMRDGEKDLEELEKLRYIARGA